MARRTNTIEFYQALLKAYREAPGQHSFAARQAGTWYQTAQRAWERGWPWLKVEWARPIKEVVAEEQHLARAAVDAERERRANAEAFVEQETRGKREEAARLLAEAEAQAKALMEQAGYEAEKSRQESTSEAEQRIAAADAEVRRKLAELRTRADWNAIEARAREGTMVYGARETVNALMGLVGEILKYSRPLANRVIALLDDPNLDARKAMSILTSLSRMVQNTNEAGHLAMVMERLHLGQPGTIIGVTGPQTEEESLAIIERARRAAERRVRQLQLKAPSAGGNGTGTH